MNWNWSWWCSHKINLFFLSFSYLQHNLKCNGIETNRIEAEGFPWSVCGESLSGRSYTAILDLTACPTYSSVKKNLLELSSTSQRSENICVVESLLQDYICTGTVKVFNWRHLSKDLAKQNWDYTKPTFCRWLLLDHFPSQVLREDIYLLLFVYTLLSRFRNLEHVMPK